MPENFLIILSHPSPSSPLHCTLLQVLQSLETTKVLPAKNKKAKTKTRPQTLEPIGRGKHHSISIKEYASRLGSKSKMPPSFPGYCASFCTVRGWGSVGCRFPVQTTMFPSRHRLQFGNRTQRSPKRHTGLPG